MINEISNNYVSAITALKSAILQSRYRAAALANSEMLSLYFGIGEYISKNSRKGFWGTSAIDSIAQRLQQELPGLRGFSATNIRRMRTFYEAWENLFSNCSLSMSDLQVAKNEQHINQPPIVVEIDGEIQPPSAVELQNTENKNFTIRPLSMGEIRPPIVVEIQDDGNSAISTLSTDEFLIDINFLINQIRQLPPAEIQILPQHFLNVGFTHHCEIIEKTKTFAERIFYIEKCALEFWSKEKLIYNLKSDLYNKQGTMLNNFTQTIANIDFQRAAMQAFKDEYLLDFVNITDGDEPDERVLENEIVLNIKKFIMALGSEFSFMGNQYRVEVDEKEYFIDLLFFNRKIQSLVAVELKRGEFKPEYAGKLNFYLSALDDLIRMPHENPSIGIILCRSQRQKTVEYAFRDTSKPIGVANYTFTKELPAQFEGILPSAEKLKELL